MKRVYLTAKVHGYVDVEDKAFIRAGDFIASEEDFESQTGKDLSNLRTLAAPDDIEIEKVEDVSDVTAKSGRAR